MNESLLDRLLLPLSLLVLLPVFIYGPEFVPDALVFDACVLLLDALVPAFDLPVRALVRAVHTRTDALLAHLADDVLHLVLFLSVQAQFLLDVQLQQCLSVVLHLRVRLFVLLVQLFLALVLRLAVLVVVAQLSLLRQLLQELLRGPCIILLLPEHTPALLYDVQTDVRLRVLRAQVLLQLSVTGLRVHRNGVALLYHQFGLQVLPVALLGGTEQGLLDVGQRLVVPRGVQEAQVVLATLLEGGVHTVTGRLERGVGGCWLRKCVVTAVIHTPSFTHILHFSIFVNSILV